MTILLTGVRVTARYHQMSLFIITYIKYDQNQENE